MEESMFVVYTCIQNSFKSIDRLIKNWNQCLESTYSKIKSLSTYVDQLESMKNVCIDTCPFGKNSTDIKTRVVNKIHIRIEEEFFKINQAMSTFQVIVQEMKTHYNRCEKEWLNKFHTFQVDTYVTTSSPFSAVTELLLSLEEIYAYYNNEYLHRRILLDNYTDNIQQLLSKWPEMNCGSKTEITLLKMQVFASLNIKEVVDNLFSQ